MGFASARSPNCWANIYRGGPDSVPASENRFKEMDILKQPSRLIVIKGGGCVMLPVSAKH